VLFDVAASTTYVINVKGWDGHTLFDTNTIHFVNNGELDNVLWNIVDDTGSSQDNVTFGTGDFYGSILAPTYKVYNASGSRIDGQIVANCFDYNNSGVADELHFIGFNADLPPTPEPSTYGLLGAVFCAGLAGFSRWRKQRAAAKTN
jgi:choice-of-anchor A domain-containing protein